MNKKRLYTPGPLCTTYSVKEKMLTDLSSRDTEFNSIVTEIKDELLSLAELDNSEYDVVLMQGSGTFGVESVITSSIPNDGHLLLLINGAYSERIFSMVNIHNIKTTPLFYAENAIPNISEVEKVLHINNTITHIAVVHCETSTGIFNPIEEIGHLAKKFNKTYIVDAMSSFGAVPIDMKDSKIDILISSSNKCIEGVPGFSFIIATLEVMENCKNNNRTLSLNLYDQWNVYKNTGQFRFTPPIQVILAFRQAIEELKIEGGVYVRAQRYRKNNEVLIEGMLDLGFKMFLSENASYIITTFLYPENPNFNFETFYKKLNDRNHVLYSGKLSNANCFRIGNIGQLFVEDMESLIKDISEVKIEMNF